MDFISPTSENAWERLIYYKLKSIKPKLRDDIHHILVEAEKGYDEAVKGGLLLPSQPAKILIPFENGFKMSLDFHNKYTNIVMRDETDTIMSEVTREHSADYEDRVLEGQFKLLKSFHVRMGYKIPESLYEILNSDLNIGDRITFNNGLSLVFAEKTDSSRIFMKTRSNTTAPTPDDFKKAEQLPPLRMSDDKAHRDLMHMIGDSFDPIIIGRVIRDTEVQGYLNKLYTDVKDGADTHKFSFFPKKYPIKIGSNDISVQYKRGNNEFIWFDEKGERVDENTVRALIGWYKTSPFIENFKRTETATYMDRINDSNVKARVHELYEQGQYGDAFNMLKEHCEREKSSLAINIHTFVEEGGNFVANSVVFQYSKKEQDCQVFKVLYEGNDFQKDPVSIKPIDARQFNQFCEKSFSNAVFSTRAHIKKEEVIEELKEQGIYDIKNLPPAGKAVITRMATDRAAKERDDDMAALESPVPSISNKLDAIIATMREQKGYNRRGGSATQKDGSQMSKGSPEER